MNVYIASDFARAVEAQAIAAACEQVPAVAVVSRWLHSASAAEQQAATTIGGPPDEQVAREAALRNLEGLERADLVVVLTTGELARGGRHFETGYALRAGTQIMLVGPVEHAFHRLPGITTTSVAQLPALLRAVAANASAVDEGRADHDGDDVSTWG